MIYKVAFALDATIGNFTDLLTVEAFPSLAI
jgi:hypothetical protein